MNDTDLARQFADIEPEVLRVLVEQKLKLWHNTVADARLDAVVAKALADEPMKTQAAQRLKLALKAIETLEPLLQTTQPPTG